MKSVPLTAGQLGEHQQHETPGERVASIEGWRPRSSKNPPDQGERSQLQDSSWERTQPQEQSDMCPSSVVILYRSGDGRLLPKRVPCRARELPGVLAEATGQVGVQWAHVMGRERVYRQLVDEGEPVRMRRRKAYRGAELGHIPAPDGMRAVYTTAPVGELVTDKIGTLTSDFTAMPNDGRNAILSGSRGPTEKQPERPRTGWLGVLADAEEAEAAAREGPW